MTISVDKSAPIPVTTTWFGPSPIADLNNWNNTAFSQLCMGKSDDELRVLIQSDKLDISKHDIALKKLAERHDDRI